MKLDEMDIKIVQRAKERPGLHLAELCRPFLTERSQTFFSKRVTCLEACGFVRTERNPGMLRIWATAKASRHLNKIIQKGLEASGNE